MDNMNRLLPLTILALSSASAYAQHAQVSAVAVHPNNIGEVWATNRDNNSVAVVNAAGGVLAAEIAVGMQPRSLAFSRDGSRVFVANSRGNVPFNRHFASPFSGGEIRGSVSVIDSASRSVIATLNADKVGVEPYGVAVSPSGKWFAVSAFASGSIHFFDAQTLQPTASYEYLDDLNFIPAPYTARDVDFNRDGIPDLGEPRGFVIKSDNAHLYVTHNKSPFISVLELTLSANGLPTGATLVTKIDTNEYPYDPVFNPVPVQILKSQGFPRFLEDIALSPDGKRALIPHVLTNVNHDVNFDFGAVFSGAFSNRVYPALTMIDARNNSYEVAGDNSNRLENELSEVRTPAEYSAFGMGGVSSAGRVTLGGTGSPLIGGQMNLLVSGIPAGSSGVVILGREHHSSLGALGTLYVRSRFMYPIVNGAVTVNIPNQFSYEGVVISAQALISTGGQLSQLSNGLHIRMRSVGMGLNKMGLRAGHPGRVAFNAAGNRALMLNRGSEDLFLYDVNGSDMELRTVFPPRIGFVERTALDTTTPMGDLPLGMVVVDDPNTQNDDALIYVVNELTRTLSMLRVDWRTGVISLERNQIPTHQGADIFSVSVRRGNEIFEDASRGQTTGYFNNSCASCHFEGGEDANVWQRPAGPRSTMPMYGGTLATGLVLWKGVRINAGETGPMFAGENGGTGIFSDAEQQSLVDFHETIAVPLNPNLDVVTGQLSAQAALGKDLFHATNDTGLNPTLRKAGCAVCHQTSEPTSGALRAFTRDFLDPALTQGEMLGLLDPTCLTLKDNFVALNLQNVNSATNIDRDHDGVPDPDRNFDGYIDVETYQPMNADTNDDFTRDDANSYPCLTDPADPFSPPILFKRDGRAFSIPTKLGVWSTAPYFHDHSAFSLRMVVDPEAQALSPIYGSPAFPGLTPYPGLGKFFNEFHDVRGHEQFVQGASKVQLDLHSTNVQADIEALLAYIASI